MSLVNISFALSAPARRAWASLQNHRQFDEVADLFFDSLRHERYRNFAVEPVFFTGLHGRRRARKSSQRPAGEKLYSTRLTLRLQTLQQMKRLESMGLTLSWQVEEILYFGFLRGYVQPPAGGAHQAA
ncbi:MAG: hypothetical protein ACOY5B_09030 [Spirochaetota bacterium]